MVRRCVFGCSSDRSLFRFPKVPWLRARWLEFLHFEEGGICDTSRICSRHFTDDCFTNHMEHAMGFAPALSLTDAAVPSVHTVGLSSRVTVKPLTRDVGCQHVARVTDVGCQQDAPAVKDFGCQKAPAIKAVGCQITPVLKNASTQASIAPPKRKIRSKAIQVRPLRHSVSVGCSMDNLGELEMEPIWPPSPFKRPRMEQSSAFDSSANDTFFTKEPEQSTHVPDVTQEDLDSDCLPVYEDNLLQLFRTCPTCTRTCQIETFVVGTLVNVTQVCAHCDLKRQWKSQPYIGNIPAVYHVFHDMPPSQRENDSKARSIAVQTSPEKPQIPDPARIKEEQADFDFNQVFEEDITSICVNTVSSQPEPCGDSSPAVSAHSESVTVTGQHDYANLCTDGSDSGPTTSSQSHGFHESSELEQVLKTCRLCGFQFCRDSELLRHMDQMHPGETPFTCPQCDKGFVNRHHLTTHLRVHTGERPHRCPFCTKKFSPSSSLNVHRRVHTGEKLYFCNTCEKMLRL